MRIGVFSLQLSVFSKKEKNSFFDLAFSKNQVKARYWISFLLRSKANALLELVLRLVTCTQ